MQGKSGGNQHDRQRIAHVFKEFHELHSTRTPTHDSEDSRTQRRYTMRLFTMQEHNDSINRLKKRQSFRHSGCKCRIDYTCQQEVQKALDLNVQQSHHTKCRTPPTSPCSDDPSHMQERKTVITIQQRPICSISNCVHIRQPLLLESFTTHTRSEPIC